MENKVRRAARLLLFQRHRKPGVKGWELRRVVGKDYVDVLELVGERLENLDLEVRVVKGDEVLEDVSEEDDLSKARFYLVMSETPTLTEAKAIGWRVDDLAALSASLSFIISRGGEAPERELKKVLERKLPDWRVDYNLDRFVKQGYLERDDDFLSVGWRTRAEVDRDRLISLLLGDEAE